MNNKFGNNEYNFGFVDRRDAYLLGWGIIYTSFGSFLLVSSDPIGWGLGFWIAGLLAVSSSLFTSLKKKAVAFSLLTGVIIFRGLSILMNFDSSGLNVDGTDFRRAILYFGIGFSHVLVSGWGDRKLIEFTRKLKE